MCNGLRGAVEVVVTMLVLVGVAAPASAQERAIGAGYDEILPIPRFTSPIGLDGRVDEPAWEEVSPLPVVMMLPDFGAEPTEPTEFRIGHDGEYLYFSCRAFESEPQGIQAATLRRDETGWASDRCGIFLDTLNDEENSLGFLTTPSGIRIDIAYANDGMQPNPDWNTYWDVAVSQDGNGWQAEFRIPFSSLLFQAEDGRVVMGLSVLRNVARKNERIVHPPIPPRWGNFSHTKASLMRKIVLEGVEQSVPVYVTPYTLAGGGYSHALNGPRNGYDRDVEGVWEVGLDLKWGVTSNLTLDLSLNTDFAQVEADDQQVNLTRFSLFFPEKRRFFQERVANFEYSLGGQERLFHSRSVGLAQGEPVRIYGGARLVGRIGQWDVGVLNMQTAESPLLPSENQGVVRLRRRILNPYSYAGGLLTTRLGSGGRRNIVYGGDAILRMADQDYLTINVSQSVDDREATFAGPSVGLLNRTLMRFNWQRRGEENLNYFLDLSRAGNAFEPRLGFLRRRDYSKGEAGLGYGWRLGPDSRLLRYGLSLNGTAVRRNADQVVETGEFVPTAFIETRAGHHVTFGVPYRHEDLEQAFQLAPGVEVPSGLYQFTGGQLQYRRPMGSLLRASTSAEAGQFFDGRQMSFSLSPGWSVSSNVNLDATYRIDHVEFAGRAQRFTAHVARLRSELMLSTSMSAIGFVQYNSNQNLVAANFRLRYNPREGNDLYLVWNEGLVTDRLGFDPVRPLSDQRALLIKYSHTFRLAI